MSSSTSDVVRDRLGACAGALFVVLAFAGNALSTAGASKAAHPTGEQVLKDVAHQAASSGATAGFILELLGFVAFIAFLAFLADRLCRPVATTATGSARVNVAAAAAVLAGILMLAVKLGSAVFVGVLLLDRTGLGPQLAQVLNDLNSVAFVLAWLPFAVFASALAVGLHRAGLVGRPTAYFGYALGVAGLVLALIGLRDAANANPLAFLATTLWLAGVSIRLAVRPGTPGEPGAVDAGRADDVQPRTGGSRAAVTG
jgi:hypothetical protein